MPPIDHFKIFKTECYMHISKQTRYKFDMKFEKEFIIGYCDKDDYRICGTIMWNTSHVSRC